MKILSLNLNGSPNIGVYSLTTNLHTILPPITSTSNIKKFKECLKGEIIHTTIGGTRLIGVLAVANSHGIVMPFYTSEEEINSIRDKWDGNIVRLKSTRNTFGNLILANDHGAVVSEILMGEKAVIKQIKDVLDVELVEGNINSLPYVGSLAATSNKAVLAHPMIKEEERDLLENVLKVHVDVGTINGGSPFVKSGLLVNDSGAIIGNLTTGPEIFIISNLFNR